MPFILPSVTGKGFLTCCLATKVVDDDEQNTVAEALGMSAILVQDLKEYRQNNYKFSWERMLNFNGDTGVFLQYTHARLHRLTTVLKCSAI